MAKFILTDLVSGISGGQAGALYRHSGGHCIRSNKNRPHNSNSPGRERQKSFMTNASQYWRTLTEAQRQSWSKVNWQGKTGFPLFLSYQCNAQLFGAAMVPVAPAPLPLPSIQVSFRFILFNSQRYEFHLEPAPGTPASDIAFFGAIWLPRGIKSYSGGYRYLDKLTNATSGNNTMTTQYLREFGVYPPRGSKCFARVVIVRHGQYYAAADQLFFGICT